MHIACLLGACERLAESLDTWSGTPVFEVSPVSRRTAASGLQIGLQNRFLTYRFPLLSLLAPGDEKLLVQVADLGAGVGAEFRGQDCAELFVGTQGRADVTSGGLGEHQEPVTGLR